MSARASVLEYLKTEAAGFNAKIADSLVTPDPPTDEQIALYVQESESKILAWEACLQVIERYINSGWPLPKPLAKFILTGLRSSRSRPTRRGRSSYTNLSRDVILINSVRLAVEKSKMKPTRNEASGTTSACDLVAECLKEIGIDLQYDTIAKVWNNRQSR